MGGVAVCLIAMSACSRDPNVRKQKFFQSGMQYFENGKYREAAIQYQSALQVDAQYTEAHYQLARCYLKLKIWNGAYNELMRTTEIDPHYLKARVDLGHLLLAAGEYKSADDEAKAALAQSPDNADVHSLIADIDFRQGHYPEAQEELNKVLQITPRSADAYIAMGKIQAAAKNPTGAEVSFMKAIELDPKSEGPVVSLGDFYLQQGRREDAEKQYQRAIELEPKAPEPRASMARVLFAEGKEAQAEQVLAQAKKDLADNPESYTMLGDLYYEEGKLDQALAEYASLYQSHNKDLRVKKNYIQLLILHNRLDEAAKLDDEVLKGDPGESEAEVLRGQILIRRGRPADALPLLQSAVKSDPQDALGHYYLGVAFNLTGDIGQAEKEWREAVRLRPTMVEAHQALADLGMRKGNGDLVRQSAEAIIAARPSSSEGYLWRARARFAAGNLPGVEADLKKAIQLAPSDPAAYSALGDLRMAEKKLSEAAHLYEQALGFDSNYSPALNGLVTITLHQAGPAKAIARVNEQITKAPGNGSYYFLLGALLGNMRDWDRSRDALEKALTLDKNNTDALLLLAQVQEAQGSLDKAIQEDQAAIQQNPKDVRTYILLGSLEEKTGNWQKAEDVYQKALQVRPDYPLAANNLAYLMLEHGGNVDAALSLAQVARRGLPESPGSADTLAWAYYQKGAYLLAIDLLQEAAKKKPNNATYLYHLGMAYMKMGNLVLARQNLHRALLLDPNSAGAAEIRKTLAELGTG